MLKDKNNEKIFIFLFILILSISCYNAGKTGPNYNNGNSEQDGNNSVEEGNSGETEILDQEKKDKEWKDKVSNQKITKMNYYFDSEGNIINNGTTVKEYLFHKCLDANTSIYYYEDDPTYLYDIGDPDSPSGLKVKIYCLVKTVEEQNKIYFLDGINNCTIEYRLKISEFIANNHNIPDWTKLPIMTENDIDTTIDIKDKRWSDWGYFGQNIIG
ncbi:hypothetical protein [Brachyspira pulli]|uniref:hypothetical protein n=1 Tax=Brachyspira pulli TaxID=310721 RepID=UPI0030065336